MFGRAEDTIEAEYREELGFPGESDAALAAAVAVVDMPDRRASLLVRVLLRNNGRLSKNKRGDLDELTGAEVELIEVGVAAARRRRIG